jgi:hypothetical protein
MLRNPPRPGRTGRMGSRRTAGIRRRTLRLWCEVDVEVVQMPTLGSTGSDGTAQWSWLVGANYHDVSNTMARAQIGTKVTDGAQGNGKQSLDRICCD